MACSSFLKGRSSSAYSAPHASPNEASAVSSRANAKNICDGRCLKNNVMGLDKSRKTWRVDIKVRPKLVISSFWQVSTSSCLLRRIRITGRTDLLWLFVSFLRTARTLSPLHSVHKQFVPAHLANEQATSAKQILFLWSHDPYTLACKARPSLDGCGTSLSVSLSLSLSLSFGFFLRFSWFLSFRCVGDLNSENLYQPQPVFLSSSVFSMFDVLHTVINTVYV